MEKNGKKAVVIGMAKSGIASAKLLYELGYDVTVNDMKTDIKGLKEELSGIEYKDALGVDHVAEADVDKLHFSPFFFNFIALCRKVSLVHFLHLFP
mgnify:CR=1 FL=1